MINWQSVIVNSFWIMGLAILLAAFSYHYWAANEANRRLRDQLNQPAFQQWYWVSFVFIGVGLVGTSQKTWEMAVWAIFTLISIVNTVRGLRNLGQS